MYYKEYPPSRELRAFIRCYFHVLTDPDTEFRFPSDGCPGLIINLGEPFLFGTGEKDFMVFTGCRLFGYLARQLTVKSLRATEVLAMKIKTGRLAAFSPVPGIELADTAVSIEHLWGAQGRDLVNRIFDTRSIPEIVQVLDIFFLKRLSSRSAIDRRIEAALDEMFNRNGQVRIDALALWTNLSRRHFERRFTTAIGLPPKRMCRIARIAGMLPHLKRGLIRGWADLAHDAGYSDQAHFIREWKYFTDFSPQRFIKELLPFESAIIGLNEVSHLFNTS